VLPGLDKDAFCIPDVDALANQMKQVIADSHPSSNNEDGISVAKQKARKARQTMQQLSPEHAVSLMAERLRELAKRRGWEFP
jgi:N-methylhydantoinase A/oxoprolinase/acetone carboxylase beta subunit